VDSTLAHSAIFRSWLPMRVFAFGRDPDRLNQSRIQPEMRYRVGQIPSVARLGEHVAP